MKNKTHSKAGVVLLEVLMAVAILAIAISGLCGLVLQGKELSGVARARYQSIVLARNQIEKARNTDFDLISGLVETGVVLNKYGEVDADGNFQRTTTITAINSVLLEILVRVDVKSRRTLEFSVRGEELQTYIALYKELEE